MTGKLETVSGGHNTPALLLLCILYHFLSFLFLQGQVNWMLGEAYLLITEKLRRLAGNAYPLMIFSNVLQEEDKLR